MPNNFINNYDLFENTNQNLIFYLIGSLVSGLLLSYLYKKEENSKEYESFTSYNNRLRSYVLGYIDNNIDDSDFYNKINKITHPDAGDVVTLKYGRWSNLIGKITKYNYDDDSYNIKVTKTLNPNDNDIPKKVINRVRYEFSAN